MAWDSTAMADIPSSINAPDTKTFLTSSAKGTRQYNPEPLKHENRDWLTIAMLVSLILLVWMNYRTRRRLNQLIGAFFSARAFNQFLREGDIRREQIIFPLIAVYLLTIPALFLELLTKIEGYGSFFRLSSFFLVLIFLSAGWFVKTTAIGLSGSIFREKDAATIYNAYNLVVNFVMGIFLLPALIVITYTSYEFIDWIVFLIVVIVLIYRIVRQFFFILSTRKFSLFHIFLYLCTLEILPLLLIIKVVLIYRTK